MKSKIGTFSVIDGLVAPEILSNNLDFLILDSEHGLENSSEQRARFYSSALSGNSEIFIRANSLDRTIIQKMLEIKPHGLLIPQITTLKDAENAIDFSFFPPIGSRGLSPYTRAFDYAADNLNKKKESLNKSLKLGLLIEGKQGMKNLEEILKKFSEHIFLIYFGIFDYSNSLGIEPSLNNEKLINGLKELCALCHEQNVCVGTIAQSPDDIRKLQKLNIDYIVYKNDSEILIDGIKSFNCT